MFGRSLFREFENDPFFAGFNSRMSGFDHVFDREMGNMWFDPRQPESDRFEDRANCPRRLVRQERVPEAPWRTMDRDFVGDMFKNMDKNFARMLDKAGTTHGPDYHHCSIYTYMNDGTTGPKTYQASTSTLQGPGGLKETRKAMRDSDRALEQYHIGRTINNRGHVKEKKINSNTGYESENEEYVNMDHEEGPDFDHEFEDRMSSMLYHPCRTRIQGHRDPAIGASTGNYNKNLRRTIPDEKGHKRDDGKRALRGRGGHDHRGGTPPRGMQRGGTPPRGMQRGGRADRMDYRDTPPRYDAEREVRRQVKGRGQNDFGRGFKNRDNF